MSKELKKISQKEYNIIMNTASTEGRTVIRDRIFNDIDLGNYDFGLVKFENCRFQSSHSGAFGYFNIRLKDAGFFNCSFCNLEFRGIDFTRAYLTKCAFDYCLISNSCFTEAVITHTSFCKCVLFADVFNKTRIDSCNFSGSNIDFTSCVFNQAHIVENTAGLDDIPMACPSEGAFIGWKKVVISERDYFYADLNHLLHGTKNVERTVGTFIVKLRIPARAKRSSATTSKCRCSEAKVLGIYDEKGKKKLDIPSIYNFNRAGAVYTVGETTYPNSYDPVRWNECSNGIHFFINKSDAVNYH